VQNGFHLVDRHAHGFGENPIEHGEGAELREGGHVDGHQVGRNAVVALHPFEQLPQLGVRGPLFGLVGIGNVERKVPIAQLAPAIAFVGGLVDQLPVREPGPVFPVLRSVGNVNVNVGERERAQRVPGCCRSDRPP
jgi:hypothetical protein